MSTSLKAIDVLTGIPTRDRRLQKALEPLLFRVFWFSRQREFRADAGAAALAGGSAGVET